MTSIQQQQQQQQHQSIDVSSSERRFGSASGMHCFVNAMSSSSASTGCSSPSYTSGKSLIHQQILNDEALAEANVKLEQVSPLPLDGFDFTEHLNLDLFEDGLSDSMEANGTTSPSSSGASPLSHHDGDFQKKVWIAPDAMELDGEFTSSIVIPGYTQYEVSSQKDNGGPFIKMEETVEQGQQQQEKQRQQQRQQEEEQEEEEEEEEFCRFSSSAPTSISEASSHSTSLNNYQFGRIGSDNGIIIPKTEISGFNGGFESTPSYMPDFNPDDWIDTSNLKYGLQISELPAKSRVETQIKVVLNFYPPPEEKVVHLPADTISKPKLQLKTPFEPSPNTLSIDSVVVCHGNLRRYANMCGGCINRERKRASRKKIRLPVEEAHWSDGKEKRVIVFNCREVVDFGKITNVEVGGQTVKGRQLELPMRLACYCRHHNEKTGFRAFFVVRDYLGNVVARGSTSPVMITDDHKAVSAPLMTPMNGGELMSKKRKSSDDGSDEYSDMMRTDPRSYSRKTPSPGGSISGISTREVSPLSDSSSGLDRRPFNGAAPIMSTEWMPYAPFEGHIPTIKRVIPGSGSIRGGIEVTILGTGFVNGLQVKFGETKSPASQCWNSTTIITHLPPAQVAGPVNVTFDGWTYHEPPKIFRYFDDTDKQLIELALQVVGLKMNGRLEDAREIARRIIGNGTGIPEQLRQQLNGTNGGGTNHCALSGTELQSLLVSCIDLVTTAESEYAPCFDLGNDEDQTMLHLASCLGFANVCARLIEAGALLDCSDRNGFTPLHFAVLHNREHIVRLLLDEGADPYVRTIDGSSVFDLGHEQVKRVLVDEYNWFDSLESRMPSSDEEDVSDEDGYESVRTSRTVSRRSSVSGRRAPSRFSRGISHYFADLRDNARQSANGFLRRRGVMEDQQTAFWNYFIPERLMHAPAPPPDAPEDASPPPSYDEIFPEGATSSASYSSAVIEQDKIAEPQPEEQEPDEEEVLQAWKDKQKQMNNDKMFLFFWLPVFIFMLVWMSVKAVSYIDAMDIGYIREWAGSWSRSVVRMGVSGTVNEVQVAT